LFAQTLITKEQDPGDDVSSQAELELPAWWAHQRW